MPAALDRDPGATAAAVVAAGALCVAPWFAWAASGERVRNGYELAAVIDGAGLGEGIWGLVARAIGMLPIVAALVLLAHATRHPLTTCALLLGGGGVLAAATFVVLASQLRPQGGLAAAGLGSGISVVASILVARSAHKSSGNASGRQ